MNGKAAKKLRKEVRKEIGTKVYKTMAAREKMRVSEEFKSFINTLSFWNKLLVCREILRGKF